MKAFAAFGLVAFLAGCSDILGDSLPLEVTTDRSSYQFGATIRLTITNVSREPVTFMRCDTDSPPRPDLRIDQLQRFGWEEVDGFGGICLGIGVPSQFLLQPGAQLEMNLIAQPSGTLRIRVGGGMETRGWSNDYRVGPGTTTIVGR